MSGYCKLLHMYGVFSDNKKNQSEYKTCSMLDSSWFTVTNFCPQGIEYFLEWSLYPTNFAYDEIRKGKVV